MNNYGVLHFGMYVILHCIRIDNIEGIKSRDVTSSLSIISEAGAGSVDTAYI